MLSVYGTPTFTTNHRNAHATACRRALLASAHCPPGSARRFAYIQQGLSGFSYLPTDVQSQIMREATRISQRLWK